MDTTGTPDAGAHPMLYHVTRNGENYGPYTLEDLQRYVASGNILATDLAKSEEMAEWSTVGQVLGGPVTPAGVAPYGAPVYAAGMPVYPDPPNLHWAVVLVLGLFTCGLFSIAWDLVQAVWMRKVNPRSNALFFYIGEVILSFGGTFARFGLMAASSFHRPYLGLGIPVSLLAFGVLEVARFDMRRSMEEHFNGPEPVGLALSGVMTFFFGALYFQYHFTRINEMKRMARYRGVAI